MKQKWIGSTSSFVNSVAEVQEAFKDVLHDELTAAVREYDSVIEQLKVSEKHANSTLTKVQKNMAKTDLSVISKEVTDLETHINSVESLIDECLNALVSIDDNLPIHEKLLAPGLPNRAHYHHIHQFLERKQKSNVMNETTSMRSNCQNHGDGQVQESTKALKSE